MGGFYGVASSDNCVGDLFYGTDYHSHLGTRRGGLATLDHTGFTRVIHNIENAQFRSKFDDDIDRFSGGRRTGHWQSRYNSRGRQVWGLAIRGDLLTCAEGDGNEKHWMKAALTDFQPAK